VKIPLMLNESSDGVEQNSSEESFQFGYFESDNRGILNFTITSRNWKATYLTL